MRVFIAVDINKQVKEAIGRLQEQLRKKTNLGRGQASWVRPDAMHLTLKFLGEIDDSQLADVCKTVGQIAAGHKSFELGIESVGFFGGRAAKVLWVGSSGGSDKLAALAKEIEDKLAQAGFPKEEREFAAHLTLCRIKDLAAGKSLAKAVGRLENFQAGTVLIDAVKVYQSQLTPTGPVYMALGSYGLG
jgi:RNA 2',3'-cyclic 3'-phosphodiesterase